MRAGQKTFAEEFERVLVEADTSVRRLARLSGVPRRTLENWLYRRTVQPRHVDPILQVARALQLAAVDTDRLLLSAGHPSLTRLRQNKQLQPDLLLEWQLPPDIHLGQKNSALRHAQQLLRQMPWNEELHREIMELLALNGRRSEALKQFEICRQVLRDELRVDPSPETVALYERIRRSIYFSRDNIPAVVTPLIGREREVEALSRLLANPNTRLVTITGLGGIGKTRLAVDIAWQHTKGQFQDGVTFVQLATLDTADLLVTAIAQALHLPLRSSDEQEALEELLGYLRSKQVLLVLDNCEHLVDGMTLAANLLEAAPQMQILATSRERLRLRAEHVFPLQGLPYDDRRVHPAAQLFLGTVQRIKPEYSINESNSVHLNRLCRLVDGLPLALELAAGALDRISVADLVDEIERSLDTLVTDLRDMPVRHRSLRAVLESTWNRLQPKAREVFAALSAFRGSFSPDAARDVAGAGTELLKRLVAHSLMEYDREAERYQLHEMLRQFAAEKLTGTPEMEIVAARRHFDYFKDLAQRGDAAMRGGDQPGWLARLELEGSNIHQAIYWGVNDDLEAAARLAISMHIFWLESGRLREAAHLYGLIVPFQEHLSSTVRPWLLTCYAEMVLYQGDTEKSLALELEALSLFWEVADHAGIAYIFLLLSRTSRRVGEDITPSIQLAEAGLQQALEPGTDAYYASLLLESLSDSLLRSGELEESAKRIRQGYQLSIERDNQIMASYFRAIMTGILMQQGDYEEARRYATESIIVARQLGLLYAEILALEALGLSATAQGKLDSAKQYFVDNHALCKEANFLAAQATSALNMSDVLLAEGSYPQAFEMLSEALMLFRQIGSQSGTAETIERLAQWAWFRNEDGLMPVRWLACAVTWIQRSGEIRSPFDMARHAEVRTAIEADLDEEIFAQAWSEGETIAVEAALEEMLLTLPLEVSGQEAK